MVTSVPYRDDEPSPWWRDDGWKGLDPGDPGPDRDDLPDADDLRDLERERKAAERASIAATLRRKYGGAR